MLIGYDVVKSLQNVEAGLDREQEEKVCVCVCVCVCVRACVLPAARLLHSHFECTIQQKER